MQDPISDADVDRIADDPDTVCRILRATTFVSLHGVAEMLGISYGRIKCLRARRLQFDEEGDYAPRSDALPPSLPIPGDPLWHLEVIMTWGRQTGRLDQRGAPIRALPTGRPRKRRRQAAA